MTGMRLEIGPGEDLLLIGSGLRLSLGHAEGPSGEIWERWNHLISECPGGGTAVGEVYLLGVLTGIHLAEHRRLVDMFKGAAKVVSD